MAGLSWEAVILAGGRGTRLGGCDKASLTGPDGRTCLERAIDACSGASTSVVVGPRGCDSRVLWAQEQPACSGPARGIRAGVAALPGGALIGDKHHPINTRSALRPRQWVLVLACDMPYASEGIPRLIRAAESVGTEVDGVVGVADGHRQWLCALYDKSALARACARLLESGQGESVRYLVEDLVLMDQPIPVSAAQDLDTGEQLRATGFHAHMKER